MRKNAKNLLYDKLHKTFVLTCVALTFGGTYLIAVRAYNYFTVVRPRQMQLRLENEKLLLSEGVSTDTQETM